jgi:antitoxin YefM
MKTKPISHVRENLFRLVDELQLDHEPLLITGKRSNAVLISEGDWNAVQETLLLVSVPGMRESIIEGMAIPAEAMSEQLDW